MEVARGSQGPGRGGHGRWLLEPCVSTTTMESETLGSIRDSGWWHLRPSHCSSAYQEQGSLLERIPPATPVTSAGTQGGDEEGAEDGVRLHHMALLGPAQAQALPLPPFPVPMALLPPFRPGVF